MASKSGVLSDEWSAVHCREYTALPIGFASANYLGAETNLALTGIKTPKYQKSIAKPASLDVLAVNMSKNFAGDSKAVIARSIMNQYEKEIKEWKPTPVVVNCPEYAFSRTRMPPPQPRSMQAQREVSDYQTSSSSMRGEPSGARKAKQYENVGTREEIYKKERQSAYEKMMPFPSAVSILARQTGLSRGEQILKQTVSTQVGTQTDTPMESMENTFRRYSSLNQVNKSIAIFNAVSVNGRVNVGQYFQGSPDLSSINKWRRYSSQEAGRVSQTMRLIEVGRARGIPGFDPESILGMNAPIPPGSMPPKSMESGTEVMTGPGSSTEKSSATTQYAAPARSAATGQGETKAPEAAMTPQVERK